MSSLTHHVARRGVQYAHAAFMKRQEGDGQEKPSIPPLAFFVLALTVLVFAFFFFAIRYTYGLIVGTLTIIESPVTEAFVAVDALNQTTVNKPNAPPAYSAEEPLMNAEPAIEITHKPITSSIRATVRHLRNKAGYWSSFRGLSLFVCWGIMRSILIGLFSLASRNPIAIAAAAVVAEVLLSRWELTWYHIIISEPSTLKWWKRMPSFRSRAWIKIAPAVAIRALTTQLVHIFPMLMVGTWGTWKHLDDPEFQPHVKHAYAMAGQGTMAVLLTLTLFVLLEIPATVTVVRVAASMLPDEYETIVPFDRSFGNKVTPAIVGGQGKIGMFEAWKSFTWDARVRLLRLVGKVFAIVMAVWVLFIAVLLVEAHLLLGDQMGDVMKRIGGKSG